MAFKMKGYSPYDKIKTKKVGAKEPSSAFQHGSRPAILPHNHPHDTEGKEKKKKSPFDKTDSPEKEKEIKNFIKNNMNNMSDNELMKKVNSMSDGETEYNWDKKTGKVESHKKDDSEEESVYGSEGGGEWYK